MEAGRAPVADGSGPRPHQQPCGRQASEELGSNGSRQKQAGVGVGGGLKVRGPNLQLLGDDL